MRFPVFRGHENYLNARRTRNIPLALLGEEVMTEVDPESGQNVHEAYVKTMTGNNMPVALSDVLSCDGKSI